MKFFGDLGPDKLSGPYLRPAAAATGLGAAGLLLALATVVAAPDALAQAVQRSAGEAAKVEQQRIGPGGGTGPTAGAGDAGVITFSDVLASPDDPSINLAYAQEMIRTGRFDIAAATLERILILHPELDRVRLLYAIVLYRLDSLDEARAELALLQKRQLARRDAAEVDRYIKAIDQRQNRHKLSLTVTSGIHFDTNRNVFPKDGVFDILGVPTTGVNEHRRSDLGLLTLGTIDYRYDTQLQNLRELFLTETVYIDKQDDETELDTFAVLLDAGFVYETGGTSFIPKLHLDAVRLDWDGYAEDYAASLRIQRRLFSPSFLGYIEAEGGYNRYHDTDTYPFGAEQAGPYYSVTVGGSYTYRNKLLIDAYYRYRNKHADVAYEAYDSHLVSGRLTYVMPRGFFVMLDAALAFQDYDGTDPFVSGGTGEVRDDTDWSVGLTYGFPLSAIGWGRADLDPLPEQLRDVVFSIGGSYQRTISNIPNFDYENWRAQMLFTKRVDF